MLRKSLAAILLTAIAMSWIGCGDQGKESSKAPVAEGQAPTNTSTPDKAAAGSPGELPPPEGFKKK